MFVSIYPRAYPRADKILEYTHKMKNLEYTHKMKTETIRASCSLFSMESLSSSTRSPSPLEFFEDAASCMRGKIIRLSFPFLFLRFSVTLKITYFCPVFLFLTIAKALSYHVLTIRVVGYSYESALLLYS